LIFTPSLVVKEPDLKFCATTGLSADMQSNKAPHSQREPNADNHFMKASLR
jgi:hypothetical protein